MAYKRYFNINGKKYGPYYYQSYRDKNGKIKKKYISLKKIKSQRKSFTPTIFFVFLLLIILGVFLFFMFEFTGKAIDENGNEQEVIQDNFERDNPVLQVVKSDSNEGLIELESSGGKVELDFELLNYSEFVENVAEIIVENESSISGFSSYKPETGFLSEFFEKVLSFPFRIRNIFGINAFAVEDIFNETFNESNNESDIENKTGMQNEPDLNLTGENVFENEAGEVAGDIAEEPFADKSEQVSFEEVKKKVEGLEESEIEGIAENAILDAENFEIASSVSDSGEEPLDEEIRLSYKLKLIDLKFMAKIKVNSEEEFFIYDDESLRIGRNLLSFSEAVAEGYKIKFDKPVLEIPFEDIEVLGKDKEAGFSSLKPEFFKNLVDFLVKRFAGITGFAGLENNEMQNNLVIYIERDFANSSYNIGDVIEFNPVLKVIPAKDAEHLDSNRNFISNIYDSIKEKDNQWSETIPADDYVRVSFAEKLGNKNDITIFAKKASSLSEDNETLEFAEVVVYRKDSSEEIARFKNINEEGWNKIYLSRLKENESYDVFDLKVMNNPVEIDYIVDPPISGCTTILTSGYYTLMRDIVQTKNANCIIISANDVTLDCMGYSISSTTISRAGIYSNRRNSIIKNCNVSMGTGSSGRGVYLYTGSDGAIVINSTFNDQGVGVYISGSSGIVLRNLTILRNRYTSYGAVWLSNSNRNNISNLVVDNNRAAGIYLSGVSDSFLENISIINNTGKGIYLTSNSKNNNLFNISVINNTNDGIAVDTVGSRNNTFSNILAENNSRSGIYIYQAPLQNLTNVFVKNNRDSLGYGALSIRNSFNNSLDNITSIFNRAYGINLWNSHNNFLKDIVSHNNSNYGIYLNPSSNNTFINVVSSNNSNSGIATSLRSFNNSFFNLLATLNRGNGNVYFNYLANSNITNAVFDYNKGTAGVRIGNSYNNIFTNLSISNSDSYTVWCSLSNTSIFRVVDMKSNANGIYFSRCSNNSFYDVSMFLTIGTDIRLVTNSQNNSFINSSYDYLKESVALGNSLARKWYYRAYVQDKNENPVFEANVSGFNASEDNQFSILTDSSGWIDKQILIEYASIGGVRGYYNNHTINATKTGVGNASHTYNLTIEENIMEDIFTLMLDASYSISMSPELSSQISWDIESLPMTQQPAIGNNGRGATSYYVSVSSQGIGVDLYAKASDDLVSADGDILGISNELYSYSLNDENVPDSNKFSLTKNFADNKIGENLREGDIVYFKFFLNAPSGQASGVYNNNLLFKAVPNGQSP